MQVKKSNQYRFICWVGERGWELRGAVKPDWERGEAGGHPASGTCEWQDPGVGENEGAMNKGAPGRRSFVPILGTSCHSLLSQNACSQACNILGRGSLGAAEVGGRSETAPWAGRGCWGGIFVSILEGAPVPFSEYKGEKIWVPAPFLLRKLRSPWQGALTPLEPSWGWITVSSAWCWEETLGRLLTLPLSSFTRWVLRIGDRHGSAHGRGVRDLWWWY